MLVSEVIQNLAALQEDSVGYQTALEAKIATQRNLVSSRLLAGRPNPLDLLESVTDETLVTIQRCAQMVAIQKRQYQPALDQQLQLLKQYKETPIT